MEGLQGCAVFRQVLTGIFQLDALLVGELAEVQLLAGAEHPLAVAACHALQELVAGLVVLHGVEDLVGVLRVYVCRYLAAVNHLVDDVGQLVLVVHTAVGAVEHGGVLRQGVHLDDVLAAAAAGAGRGDESLKLHVGSLPLVGEARELLLHVAGLQRQRHLLTYDGAAGGELYFADVLLGVLAQREAQLLRSQQLLAECEIVNTVLGTVNIYLELL